MTWLDSITPNFMLSEDKRIQKEQRNLTNRDKQAEDRELAAHWLSDHGSPKALVALLSRFDMKLDHQMHDRQERELVYGILLAHGAQLERPLKAHLRRCQMIAMPLRLLAELQGDPAAVEMAFELLEIELERDDFKPGKKTDLLVWLVDYTHPRAIEAVTPLLKDFDEGVRYAAAEVILAQNDDAGMAPLEAVLKDEKEESNRLRSRLAEAFARKRWKVADEEGVAAMLFDGFELRDGVVVAKAG